MNLIMKIVILSNTLQLICNWKQPDHEDRDSQKQVTATHCNSLTHTDAHCHTLQHNCNRNESDNEDRDSQQHTATHCNTLQHTATQLQLEAA